MNDLVENTNCSLQLWLHPEEEDIWLANQRSHHTRRAYRADIKHFIRSLRLTSREHLLATDRAMLVFWRRLMEQEGVRPRTIQRRLAALSSLFTHFIEQGLIKKYAAQLGIERGYSAYSCRSTFITHALKSGAKLEHVQQTVGHAHLSTTQSYDRNNFDPEKSATFFANFK